MNLEHYMIMVQIKQDIIKMMNQNIVNMIQDMKQKRMMHQNQYHLIPMYYHQNVIDVLVE